MWHVRYSSCSAVILAAVVGCRDAGPGPGNTEDPPKKAKIDVHAPGVDVEVDRQKGKVKVKAPGVDIQVEKK